MTPEEMRADAERYRALRGWAVKYGHLVIGWTDYADPGERPDLHWRLSFGRVSQSDVYGTLDAAVDAERSRE